MHLAFFLDISYSQVALFDSALDQPFNFWTDRHIAQGFAWRPGSVSFATIAEAGKHVVEVIAHPEAWPEVTEADRIIQVPFEVPAKGIVEVASISDAKAIRLPHGRYALLFEYLQRPDGQEPKITLRLSRSDDVEFKIVRADAALSATSDLLITAEPA